jgi:AcrR family transcriptional regulator
MKAITVYKIVRNCHRYDTIRYVLDSIRPIWVSKVMASSEQKHSAGQNGGKRPPGRPRCEQSQKAILRSTLKLLQKTGFADLSIEAIAAHAGVGKATVYRWWPNKGALVVDAFAAITTDDLHFPDCGSVYKDVSLQMNRWLGVLRSPRGRIVAAVIGGGQSDAELIEAFRSRFLRPRRQEAYQTLRRGIERGELPRDLDLDVVLDTLYGAIYMRFLIRHDDLSERYINEVCRMVLDGASTNGSPVRKGQSRLRAVNGRKLQNALRN